MPARANILLSPNADAASPGPGPDDAQTLAALYVAGAMQPEEARSFERRLHAGEAEIVRAVAALRPTMDALASAAPEMTPSAQVKLRVMERIGAPLTAQPAHAAQRTRGVGGDVGVGSWRETDAASEMAFSERAAAGAARSAAAPGVTLFTRDDDSVGAASGGSGWSGGAGAEMFGGKWKPTGIRGVSYRTLYADRATNRRTFLLKAEPGASLPEHGHAGAEEVYVLTGDLALGERTLRPGEGFRCEAGYEHAETRTSGGCVCLIVCDYVPYTAGGFWRFIVHAVKSLFRRA